MTDCEHKFMNALTGCCLHCGKEMEQVDPLDELRHRCEQLEKVVAVLGSMHPVTLRFEGAADAFEEICKHVEEGKR